MSTLAQLLMGVSGDRYQIGEYYADEGGYYAGLMEYPEGVCALFLAPKSAEITAQLSTGAPVYGTSVLDGRYNTYLQQLPNTSFPALTHCYNYAGGGHKDWYLGSRQEMVKVFRELARAAGGDTSTMYGAVPESIPAYLNFNLQPSTASSSANFIAGGEQALDAAWYWSSTTFANNVSMASGTYLPQSTTNSYRVRPIRRKLVTPKQLQTVIGSNIGFSAAIGTARRTWQVPDGVHSISVLLVGRGGFGTRGQNYNEGSAGGAGGRSAAVSYMNDIPVVPGQVIEITSPDSVSVAFGDYFSTNTGTQLPRTYALAGGAGSAGKGGHGGSGTGHVDLILPGAPALLGNGVPGTSSTFNPNGGNGGSGAWPGGGAGGGGGAGLQVSGGTPSGGAAGIAANGAIRIIWPGTRRKYPNIDTADEVV